MTAAFGAKLVNLAAAPPEPADTIVAHDFAAMKAAISASRLRMTQANQRTIRQHHRRNGGRWDTKSRDADGDFRGFSSEFDFAETKRAALGKFGRDDGFSVNESPIRGIAVADDHRVTGQLNLAMDC